MSKKEAFTLLEVLVSVLIIVGVIAALLELRQKLFFGYEKSFKSAQSKMYGSLLMHSKYGFEKEKSSLDRLCEEFDMDDDLRRRLKKIKVALKYQRVALPTKEQNSSNRLEVGVTSMLFDSSKNSFVRVRLP